MDGKRENVLRRQKNTWRSHQTLVSHMSVAFVGQPQKGRTTARRIPHRAPARLALRNQGKLVATVAEGLVILGFMIVGCDCICFACCGVFDRLA